MSDVKLRTKISRRWTHMNFSLIRIDVVENGETRTELRVEDDSDGQGSVETTREDLSAAFALLQNAFAGGILDD